MISLLVKLVIIVLLVLAIAGFLRTWQVQRGENQKAFLAGTAPNPAPNELYNGKVQNMSTSWLGKMFDSAANSGINLFYNGDGTDVEKYPFKTYAGKGCRFCGDTGYSGRIAIFEVLPLSDGIKELILVHKSDAELRRLAREEGMITMKQDGLIKVIKGLTTLEEVMRVTKE